MAERISASASGSRGRGAALDLVEALEEIENGGAVVVVHGDSLRLFRERNAHEGDMAIGRAVRQGRVGRTGSARRGDCREHCRPRRHGLSNAHFRRQAPVAQLDRALPSEGRGRMHLGCANLFNEISRCSQCLCGLASADCPRNPFVSRSRNLVSGAKTLPFQVPAKGCARAASRMTATPSLQPTIFASRTHPIRFQCCSTRTGGWLMTSSRGVFGNAQGPIAKQELRLARSVVPEDAKRSPPLR